MSHVVQTIVERRKVGSAPRKAVLSYMAARASDDGSGVWTSKANIARDTELAKRTVQYAIIDMLADGLLEKVGTRPCKSGETDEYALQIDAISRLESTRATDAPVQDVHPPRATGAPHPVQQVHPNNPLITHEPPKDITREAFDFFNRIAEGTGWPQCQLQSDPRKRALTARIKDCGGLENWKAAITTASRSSLLTGNNDRGWKASFDWLCKQSNFIKLMEGNYNDQSSSNQGKAGMAGEDAALKQIARLAGLR